MNSHYPEESLVGKLQAFAPPQKQVQRWKEIYPQLEGGLDSNALQQTEVAVSSLREQGFHYRVIVLPDFEKLFGRNQPPVLMDMSMIDVFREHACKTFGFSLFNECISSGTLLLQERDGYARYTHACRNQKGDFRVIAIQFGQYCPYDEGSFGAPQENDIHLPIGISMAALIPQHLPSIWAGFPNWWIGCGGSGAMPGYGARAHPAKETPCIEYLRGFCGVENTVSILPLAEVYAWEGEDRRCEGGFMTALSLE